MHILSLFTLVLAPLFVAAAPLPQSCDKAVFLLVGDSTTAPQSDTGGGWGNGFLSDLMSPSTGVNMGFNGRTTKSYIDNGEWSQVLDNVHKYKSNAEVYVTIQFGHNEHSESMFKKNLEIMVKAVKFAGGTPILVTPLSRRYYNADGSFEDMMGTWAGYTRSVASETSTASIDLWKDSMAYLEMIGETEARRMDLKAGDYTHLNAAGGKVFGRLVSDLLSKNKVVGREARCVTTADAALNLKIVDGKPGF